MGLGDLAGDGEAEARSFLGPRRVSPVEALEDERQLVLGDTDPRVGDGQPHAVAPVLHPDCDAPTVRGVLHGVVQEDGSDLKYALPVESGHHLVLARDELDRYPAVCGGTGGLGRLLRDRTEVVTADFHGCALIPAG